MGLEHWRLPSTWGTSSLFSALQRPPRALGVPETLCTATVRSLPATRVASPLMAIADILWPEARGVAAVVRNGITVFSSALSSPCGRWSWRTGPLVSRATQPAWRKEVETLGGPGTGPQNPHVPASTRGLCLRTKPPPYKIDLQLLAANSAPALRLPEA